MLIFVAVSGAGLAAAGSLWSHSSQREKEQELLFVGNQYRQAIASYYQRSPGGVKLYPQHLDDLLHDRRHPGLQRHLRRLYPDPITGSTEWGLVRDPQGRIMGVHSLSEEQPFKTGGFAARDQNLENKARYLDWQFVALPG